MNIFGNVKTVAGVMKLENASVLLLNVLLRSLNRVRLFMDNRAITHAFAMTNQNFLLNFDTAMQNLGERIAIWNTPASNRFVKAKIASMLDSLQVSFLSPVTHEVFTAPKLSDYSNLNAYVAAVHA